MRQSRLEVSFVTEVSGWERPTSPLCCCVSPEMQDWKDGVGNGVQRQPRISRRDTGSQPRGHSHLHTCRPRGHFRPRPSQLRPGVPSLPQGSGFPEKPGPPGSPVQEKCLVRAVRAVSAPDSPHRGLSAELGNCQHHKRKI